MSQRMTPTNLPKQAAPIQRASLGSRKQPSNLIAASAYSDCVRRCVNHGLGRVACEFVCHELNPTFSSYSNLAMDHDVDPGRIQTRFWT